MDDLKLHHSHAWFKIKDIMSVKLIYSVGILGVVIICLWIGQAWDQSSETSADVNRYRGSRSRDIRSSWFGLDINSGNVMCCAGLIGCVCLIFVRCSTEMDFCVLFVVMNSYVGYIFGCIGRRNMRRIYACNKWTRSVKIWAAFPIWNELKPPS
jgi:hypothetical protein